jgi:hypothetical protein
VSGERLTIRRDPFVLPVPGGWVDRTVVTLTGPEVEGFAPNIVVTAEPLCDGLGLGGFASGWVARIAEHVAVRELRKPEHVRIAGEPAQVRTLGWADAGVSIAQRAALVVHDGIAYAIVVTAPADGLDEADAVLADVLGGFAFADEEAT